jgi:hypothetical protein
MAEPSFLVGGSTPHVTDTRWFQLARINGAAAGGGGGGLNGAGSPVGVVTPTALNQWYHDDTNDAYWWSTGLTNLSWIQAI